MQTNHKIGSTLVLSVLGLAPLLAASLQGCSSPASVDDHWSYEGSSGPEHWFPEFTEATMKAQSPIRIPASSGGTESAAAPPSLLVGEIPLGDLEVPSTVSDNGHTVVVSMPPNSNIRVETKGGLTYKLLQYHFHAPSEHAIDNQGQDGFFPLAVHAVHQSIYGDYLVVGRVFEVESSSPIRAEEQAADEALGEVFRSAGENPKSLGNSFNSTLLGAFYEGLMDGAYYYEGSLTTPPCTEKVHWVVGKHPLRLSRETLEHFTDKYGAGQHHFPDGNRRPIQATNGRAIFEVSQ